ncbi:MAG: GntR family transcriptional regulator [Treponema sp.]|jgi:DNA-binding LacI/PurR family transcriptional regulator|nr:GntR family transcriptional regulator [Treponema sp.]
MHVKTEFKINAAAQVKPAMYPYYKHIYDHLLEQISSGKLNAGDKLPSEKELCGMFGVSRITSKKALELLAEEGLISRLPGKGSFVGGSPGRKAVRSFTASRFIGLIISDFNDAFGTRLLYAIEEACTALGYHLILKRTRDSAAEEERALKSLADESAAGILMLPAHGEYYNAEILKQILNKRPLVFVDRKMKGLPVPSVATDNVTTARLGVEYLLRLGHRNIAFYSGPVEYISTVEARWNGFIKAFADSGIVLDPAFVCLNISTEDGMDAVKDHLAERPEITAAFASEFSIALIVKHAAWALGRSIPGDLSLITVDSPVYTPDGPALTFLRQDEDEIGKRAVESLHAIIMGADPSSIGDILIPAQLLTGGSTLPPKKNPGDLRKKELAFPANL